uniref:BZIP domain-containing protein n=1 Tax=Ananas comosus var. bracteatus TaxID=296719 RepID=A0A6V7QH37_ANACO|nr:unnamed protein product [Ananas comosus var. bracteatus]
MEIATLRTTGLVWFSFASAKWRSCLRRSPTSRPLTSRRPVGQRVPWLLRRQARGPPPVSERLRRISRGVRRRGWRRTRRLRQRRQPAHGHVRRRGGAGRVVAVGPQRRERHAVRGGGAAAGAPPQEETTAAEKIVDPRGLKGDQILANRQSAQRSRVRKLQYISELERSVTTLQTEVSALSPRVAFLDHQRSLLTVGNSHLKQRIAALAQDNIFKDAHQEELKKELERLREVYYQQKLRNMDAPDFDASVHLEKELLNFEGTTCTLGPTP